jgi:hypothetical protein
MAAAPNLLRRAGVTVAASPTGPNPAALLPPPPNSYQAGDKLAEHTSASLPPMSS